VYVVGALPRGLSVGIVGTRDPTEEGREFAFKLARDLAEAGVAVVSGGAAGIDTAAHRGALAGKGSTVVVAPSSFDRPFPEWNADLFRDVVTNGGAFLTTHPAGTPARRHHFFPRNAVLVALARALVVVETRPRGGARNAAKAARDLGRRLLVVPGAPWNHRALGCILELQNGAEPVASAKDVLQVLGVPAPLKLTNGPVSDGFQPKQLELAGSVSDPDREALLSILKNGPLDPDAICRATALPAARVQALLLTLTLERILVSQPSGRIALASG
jgi:DNA processing protein